VARAGGGPEGELQGFFSRKPLTFKPAKSPYPIEPIESANIDELLWAPVLRKPALCTWAELGDGTYTLDDWADMLEAMSVEQEYHRRAEAEAERQRKAAQKKP